MLLRCCPSDRSISLWDISNSSWELPGQLYFIPHVPESESSILRNLLPPETPLLSSLGKSGHQRRASQTPKCLCWLAQHSPISRTEHSGPKKAPIPANQGSGGHAASLSESWLFSSPSCKQWQRTSIKQWAAKQNRRQRDPTAQKLSVLIRQPRGT